LVSGRPDRLGEVGPLPLRLVWLGRRDLGREFFFEGGSGHTRELRRLRPRCDHAFVYLDPSGMHVAFGTWLNDEEPRYDVG
jgi:hypothetical protein